MPFFLLLLLACCRANTVCCTGSGLWPFVHVGCQRFDIHAILSVMAGCVHRICSTYNCEMQDTCCFLLLVYLIVDTLHVN